MFENVSKKTTAVQIFFSHIWKNIKISLKRHIKVYPATLLKLLYLSACASYLVFAWSVLSTTEMITTPLEENSRYLAADLLLFAFIFHGFLYFHAWIKFRTRLPISEEDFDVLQIYTKEDFLLFLDAFRYRKSPLYNGTNKAIAIFPYLEYTYKQNSIYYTKMLELFKTLPQYTDLTFEDGDNYNFVEYGIETLEKSTLPLKATASLIDEIHTYFEGLDSELEYKKQALEKFEKIKEPQSYFH